VPAAKGLIEPLSDGEKALCCAADSVVSMAEFAAAMPGSSLQALKYRAVQSNVLDRVQRDMDNKTSAQTGCLVAYTSDEFVLCLTERASQIRHKAAPRFKGECWFARYQGTSGIRGATVLMIFQCDSFRILAVIGLSGLLMSCAGGTGESGNSEAAEQSSGLPNLGAGLPAVEQPQVPQPQTAQPPFEQAEVEQPPVGKPVSEIETDAEPDLGGALPDVEVVMQPEIVAPEPEPEPEPEPVGGSAEEPVEMGMAEAASSGDTASETGGETSGGSADPDVAVVMPEQGGSEPPACAPGYIWVEPGAG